MRASENRRVKRVYAKAAVLETTGGFTVHLDGKGVRTPGGNALLVSARPLAEALAGEWNAQGETVLPQSMPLTRLSNTAIDGVRGRNELPVDDLVRYAAFDLVCYRASVPADLAAKQAAAWDPVIDWARQTLGVQLMVSEGVKPVEQPRSSLDIYRTAVSAFPAFELTALHTITALTGSAFLGLYAFSNERGPDEIWEAAKVDEDWQEARWGKDSEAAARRDSQYIEFKAAFHLFTLLKLATNSNV